MNPGYVSIWIVISIAILLATGWREFVADRIRWPYLALLAGGSAFLAPFGLPLDVLRIGENGGTISLACCWMLAWAVVIIVFVRQDGSQQRLYMVFSSMFAAIVGGWLSMLYMNDPVLVIFHPAFDDALLIGLTAALSAPLRAETLFAVVALSAIAEPLVIGWFAPSLQMKPVEIGSLAWWDSFLIAWVTARTIGLLIKAVRTKAGKWFVRSAGEREGGA